MEIEIKFPLKNPDEVLAKISKLGRKIKEERQKDTYFVPSHRNFIKSKPISEWLRIRESEKGSSINYKNWHKEIDMKSISCDEYESKIEDAEEVKKLFAAIDIKEIIAVDKHRQEFLYKDCKVSIDEVKELGSFIEVESSKREGDVDKIRKELMDMIKELCAKVGEQDFKGYPALILEKKILI